ncbi:hypothetical protein ABPG72_003031 [Tetrahymena utriculariae]
MAESLKKVTLYSYFRSSTSWRVRIALNLKKIEYSIIPINLLKSEQTSEEYTKINPNQGVPALKYGDEVIIESSAILEFLEEVFPEHPLLPQDAIKRAQIRGFCQVINTAIHPLQNLRVLNQIEKEYNQDKIQWLKFWVAKGLTAIEELLKKSHGKYSFGDEITLADLFLVPQVQGVVDRFQFDLTPFPNIAHVLNNLKEIPEFVAASPSKQADNPDNQKI